MDSLPFSLVSFVEDGLTDTNFSLERQKVIIMDRLRMVGMVLREIGCARKFAKQPRLWATLVGRFTRMAQRLEARLATIETDLRYVEMANVPAVPRRAAVLDLAAVTRSVAARVARYGALLTENSEMRQRVAGRVLMETEEDSDDEMDGEKIYERVSDM